MAILAKNDRSKVATADLLIAVYLRVWGTVAPEGADTDMVTAAQIRVDSDTAWRLSVLAGIWGCSVREAAGRIVETYVSGDPRLAQVLRDAEAAKGGAK